MIRRWGSRQGPAAITAASNSFNTKNRTGPSALGILKVVAFIQYEDTPRATKSACIRSSIVITYHLESTLKGRPPLSKVHMPMGSGDCRTDNQYTLGPNCTRRRDRLRRLAEAHLIRKQRDGMRGKVVSSYFLKRFKLHTRRRMVVVSQPRYSHMERKDRGASDRSNSHWAASSRSSGSFSRESSRACSMTAA